MKPAACGLAGGLPGGPPTAAFADDLDVDRQFAGTQVGFALKGSYHNLTLSIAGPNDFHATASAKSGAPSIDLHRFGPVEDGIYTYQLTAATDQQVKSRSRLDDGRGAGAAVLPLRSVATSGTFRVEGGAIVQTKVTAQPSRRDEQ